MRVDIICRIDDRQVQEELDLRGSKEGEKGLERHCDAKIWSAIGLGAILQKTR